jgi:hypothetical protein
VYWAYDALAASQIEAPVSVVAFLLFLGAMQILASIVLWRSPRRRFAFLIFLALFALCGVWNIDRFAALLPAHSGAFSDLIWSRWGLLLLAPLAFAAGAFAFVLARPKRSHAV